MNLKPVKCPKCGATDNTYFYNKHLERACCVWVHEPSEYVDAKDSVAFNIAMKLGVEKNKVDGLIADLYQDGDDATKTLEKVLIKAADARSREELAAKMRELLPMGERRSLDLVEEYFAHHPNRRDEKTALLADRAAHAAGTVLMWALNHTGEEG